VPPNAQTSLSPEREVEVIGLGVSTVDVVALVDHFPSTREVQQALELKVQGGGPVATAMAALAKLGATVEMVDMLGDDWRASIIRNDFNSIGVGQHHLRTAPGCTSSTSLILVKKNDGHRAIAFFPGSVPELTADDIDDNVIAHCRFLHINGRHLAASYRACQLARNLGVKVSFDGGANRFSPDLKPLVARSDVCIAARDFAEHYTGQTNWEATATCLLREGPDLVVITDGINGSWIHKKDAVPFHQPAFLHRRAIDTTGCGDSFHGAFLFGLIRGLSIRDTAALASAVAAMNSWHLGGRTGLPTYTEAQQFLHDVMSHNPTGLSTG
jgi:sulfofructose kinase